MNIGLGHTVVGGVDIKNSVVMVDIVEGLRNDRRTNLDVSTQHWRKVIHAEEEMIRQGLIKLGWTPPPARRDAAGKVIDATPPAVRARLFDPFASKAAAAAASEFAGNHKERILSALEHYELSSHQIAVRSGLTVVQVDRRMHELRASGRVELVMDGAEPLDRHGYRVWRRVGSIPFA